jgi:F-box and leucine-rich repeat protein 2/20
MAVAVVTGFPEPLIDDLVVEDVIPEGSETPEISALEGPARKKTRRRLVRGLSRISSSPTLAQLGRARSFSSPSTRPGSLSCVSLVSSPPPLGALSPGSLSPPTSPAFDYSSQDAIGSRLVIRRLENVELVADATSSLPADVRSKKSIFNIWASMPHEIKIQVFNCFEPKELVRLSRVNKEFHKICFDGQLWTCFDASEFYKEIPAESLAKIIVTAGPFVKDLNLRGCVQVEHYKRAEVIVKACRNLINATLEGCRNFQKTTLHTLLRSNEKLANLNLTGLTAVTNRTCDIIAQSCPQLEMFNVSWCKHMDAGGIKSVLEGCAMLKDLRAGEITGFDSRGVAETMFKTNRLERLVLSGCGDLNDTTLRMMIHGPEPELDVLTDRPLVPPRKLRHLDLSRCSHLTSHGVKALAHFVPDLEGLQLSGCTLLTDDSLEGILASTPRLTHLELEDLAELTNTLLSEHLAKAPCASNLQHLSVSYCENLGDTGMLPVMRVCKNLRSTDLDNTRISDLVLAEAAAMVRARSGRTRDRQNRPRVGLSMVVYDCSNVTWTGVREVLSRNAEIINPKSPRPALSPGEIRPPVVQTYPTEVISLKCFYGWQMTVDEHTKRVLKGDLAAASRLERKWADYMQANEEAGVVGAGVRRRRRRAREAQQVHADEEEGGVGIAAGRRRARTAACVVM